MRDWAKNAGLLALSLFAVLLACEGVLRLLPVSEGLRAQPVNDKSPILHFEPNRTSTWSAFGTMAMANRVHVNNEGFVNDQDYDPAASGPLVAVVGDSFVEAAMVPYARTLHGRLAESLRGRARVYSFAASGAALSQYLAYAAYARDRFHPQRGVVVVVGNDFDESLLEYTAAPGLHAFRCGPDGQAELVRTDYAPGALRQAIRHFRLALYLVNNMGVGSLRERLAGLFAPRAAFVGQTSASLDEKRLNDSLFAIDAFLAMLPQSFGLPPEDILLVLDAPRPDIYDPQACASAQSSYFGRMRATLKERAQAAGLRVVDMQGHFLRDFAQNGQRFEFLRDGHWNGRGHQVAAQAVLSSGLLDGLLDGPR